MTDAQLFHAWLWGQVWGPIMGVGLAVAIIWIALGIRGWKELCGKGDGHEQDKKPATGGSLRDVLDQCKREDKK